MNTDNSSPQDETVKLFLPVRKTLSEARKLFNGSDSIDVISFPQFIAEYYQEGLILEIREDSPHLNEDISVVVAHGEDAQKEVGLFDHDVIMPVTSIHIDTEENTLLYSQALDQGIITQDIKDQLGIETSLEQDYDDEMDIGEIAEQSLSEEYNATSLVREIDITNRIVTMMEEHWDDEQDFPLATIVDKNSLTIGDFLPEPEQGAVQVNLAFFPDQPEILESVIGEDYAVSTTLRIHDPERFRWLDDISKEDILDNVGESSYIAMTNSLPLSLAEGLCPGYLFTTHMTYTKDIPAPTGVMFGGVRINPDSADGLSKQAVKNLLAQDPYVAYKNSTMNAINQMIEIIDDPEISSTAGYFDTNHSVSAPSPFVTSALSIEQSREIVETALDIPDL